MGGEANGGDIWDLKLEDLFASAPAESQASQEHVGPYVINLATSVEPISLPSSSLLKFDGMQVYQVTAWKSDRLLFRLRLGPVDTELQANAIVADILKDYPEASALPACEDDIRMIAAVAASSATRTPSAPGVKGARASAAPPTRETQPTEASPKRIAPDPIQQVMNARPPPPAAPPPRVSLSASAAPRTPSPGATGRGGAPHSPPSWLQEAARAVLDSAAPLSPFTAADARRVLARDATPNVAPAQPVSAAPAQTAAAPPAPPTEASRAASPPIVSGTPVAERARHAEAAPIPRAESKVPVDHAAASSVAPAAPPAISLPVAKPAPHAVEDLLDVSWDEGPADADEPFLSLSLEPAPAPVPARTLTAPVVAKVTEPVTIELELVPDAAASPAIKAIPPSPRPATAAPSAAPPSSSVPKKAETPPARPSERDAPADDGSKDDLEDTIESLALSLMIDLDPASLESTKPTPLAVPAPAAPPATQARSATPPPPKAPALRGTGVEIPTLAAPVGTGKGHPAAPGKSAPAAAPGATKMAIPILDTPVARGSRRARKAAARAAQAQATSLPRAERPAPPAPSSAATTIQVPRTSSPPVASTAPPTASPVSAPIAVSPPPAPAPIPAAAPVSVSHLPAPHAPASHAPAPRALSAPPPEPAVERRTVIRAIPAPRVVQPAPSPVKPTTVPSASKAPAASPPAPVAVAPPAKPFGAARGTDPQPLPAHAAAASPAARPAPAPTPVAPPHTPVKVVRPAAHTLPRQPVKPAVAAPAAPSRASPPSPPPRPAAPASGDVRHFEVLPGPVADMDSTMTMRALSLTEIEAGGGERLFVIQLALSSREIPADQIPNLAIFNEFRLYAAVGREDGKVMHALRLGFFTDEAPAQAVAGYLAGYFDAPKVTRVSSAERERFGERRISGRKDSGESGIHAAIEMSSPDQAPTTSLADLKIAAAQEVHSLRRPPPRR